MKILHFFNFYVPFLIDFGFEISPQKFGDIIGEKKSFFLSVDLVGVFFAGFGTIFIADRLMGK